MAGNINPRYLSYTKAEVQALLEEVNSLRALLSLPTLMAYAECSTGAGTATKTVAITGYSLPTNGGCLHIKMTHANTAASNVKLNINTTGAKPLYYNGSAVSATNTWKADEVLEIYYDGENYQATNAQGGGGSADRISFENSESGLSAENVKSAIDETNQKWRVRVTPSDSGDSGSGSGDSGSSESGSSSEGSGESSGTTAFGYYESEPLATYSGDYSNYYNVITWKNVPSTSKSYKEVRLKPQSAYTFTSKNKANAVIYVFKRTLSYVDGDKVPGELNWWNRTTNVRIFNGPTTKILNNGTFTLENNTDEEVGYVFTVGAGYTDPLNFTLISSDYDESSGDEPTGGDEPVEPEPSGGDEPTPSEPEVQYEEYDAEKLLEKMQDMIDDAMQSSSQTPSSEPSGTPSQVISDASDITFNRATNNLSSENVQAAIEEVNAKVDSIATSDDSSETSLLWENITHVWEYGLYNRVDYSLGVYYMNKEIGEKFAQSTNTASGYTRNVYKVEPGDKLKFRG